MARSEQSRNIARRLDRLLHLCVSEYWVPPSSYYHRSFSSDYSRSTHCFAGCDCVFAYVWLRAVNVSSSPGLLHLIQQRGGREERLHSSTRLQPPEPLERLARRSRSLFYVASFLAAGQEDMLLVPRLPGAVVVRVSVRAVLAASASIPSRSRLVVFVFVVSASWSSASAHCVSQTPHSSPHHHSTCFSDARPYLVVFASCAAHPACRYCCSSR